MDAASRKDTPTPPPPATVAKAATSPFKNLHSREYLGHKKKVHSVAWNCIGTKLASGSVDQTARIWHIEPHGHSKVKEVELRGHTDSVDQLCWDPKHADLLATASGDRTVRVWDAQSGKCSQQIGLSGENINIAYRHDGTFIAVGNRDDEVTILDVRKFDVNELAWNLPGDMFFLTTGFGEKNGCVEVLAFPSLKPIDTLIAHTAGCYCIAIDPKGRYFAVGSADSLVSLWDIRELLCVRTFTKLEWPVRTISFNYTGEYIASASEDLLIDIASLPSLGNRQILMLKLGAQFIRYHAKLQRTVWNGIRGTTYLHVLEMTRTNIKQTKVSYIWV
ncbi:THO complex subunit 3-like protein [Drosera capensis]